MDTCFARGFLRGSNVAPLFPPNGSVANIGINFTAVTPPLVANFSYTTTEKGNVTSSTYQTAGAHNHDSGRNKPNNHETYLPGFARGFLLQESEDSVNDA